MSLIEQIKDVMSEHRGPAHVNEIALMVTERFPNIQVEPAKLPAKISAVLSSNAKKKGTKSSFSKVKSLSINCMILSYDSILIDFSLVMFSIILICYLLIKFMLKIKLFEIFNNTFI